VFVTKFTSFLSTTAEFFRFRQLFRLWHSFFDFRFRHSFLNFGTFFSISAEFFRFWHSFFDLCTVSSILAQGFQFRHTLFDFGTVFSISAKFFRFRHSFCISFFRFWHSVFLFLQNFAQRQLRASTDNTNCNYMTLGVSTAH